MSFKVVMMAALMVPCLYSVGLRTQNISFDEFNPGGRTPLDSDIIGAMRIMLGRPITREEFNLIKYMRDINDKKLGRLAQVIVAQFPEVQQHLNLVPPNASEVERLKCKNGVVLWGFKSDKVIAKRIRELGNYEPDLERLARNIIRKGDYVIDAGSNIGYHTGVFAQSVGENGKVFAIEALPMISTLVEKMRDSNNFHWVDVLNFAISDTTGEVDFLINAVNPGKSCIISSEEASKLQAIGSEYTIKVPMSTLDELLGDLPKLSFIKMDVEGAEALAIAGGLGIIKKFKPTLIIEFTPEWLRNTGVDPVAFLQQFLEMGYRIGTVPELSKKNNPRASLLTSKQLSAKQLVKKSENKRVQVDLVFIHKGES